MLARLATVGLALVLVSLAFAAPAGATVSAKSTPAYEKPSAAPLGPAVHFWWHINYDSAASNMAVCFRFKVDNGAWQFPTNGDTTGVPPANSDRPSGSCQSVGGGFNGDYFYRGDQVQ